MTGRSSRNSTGMGPDYDPKYKAEVHNEEARIDAVYKFRFFFAGLVFAILAFSMQFSVMALSICLNIIQILSWISLGITGFLSLKDCGGFAKEYTKEALSGISPKLRISMYFFFLLGISLQMVIRGFNLF